ncbi:MAG: hypothetical protein MZU79_07505 [Anaerotruncus sp.]|nr:hypothetical protein [Anaerotruncus sp.]
MEKLAAEGHRIERIRKSGVMARILDLGRVDASEGLEGLRKGGHPPHRRRPAAEGRRRASS